MTTTFEAGVGHVADAAGVPLPVNNSSYTRHGCRCAGCTAAHTAYNVEYQRRRVATDPEFVATRRTYHREYARNRRRDQKGQQVPQ